MKLGVTKLVKLLEESPMSTSLWLSETFPQFEAAIRDLVAQHLELDGEPLHLAIAFAPQRDPQDLFLFEVVGGILEGSMSEDRELFEVCFLPASGFPLKPGQQLHLILTNRVEIKAALAEGWPTVQEIIDAVHAGDYRIVHEDEIGREVFGWIQQLATKEQEVGHG